MLEIYSTDHRHITNKVNSQNSTFETTHPKQLPNYAFVFHTIANCLKFSNNFKLVGIGTSDII